MTLTLFELNWSTVNFLKKDKIQFDISSVLPTAYETGTCIKIVSVDSKVPVTYIKVTLGDTIIYKRHMKLADEAIRCLDIPEIYTGFMYCSDAIITLQFSEPINPTHDVKFLITETHSDSDIDMFEDHITFTHFGQVYLKGKTPTIIINPYGRCKYLNITQLPELVG